MNIKIQSVENNNIKKEGERKKENNIKKEGERKKENNIKKEGERKKRPKEDDCPIHVRSSTHERLMRKKKTGSQTFDNVIVEILDENIELKRKLRAKSGVTDGKTESAINDITQEE